MQSGTTKKKRDILEIRPGEIVSSNGDLMKLIAFDIGHEVVSSDWFQGKGDQNNAILLAYVDVHTDVQKRVDEIKNKIQNYMNEALSTKIMVVGGDGTQQASDALNTVNAMLKSVTNGKDVKIAAITASNKRTDYCSVQVDTGFDDMTKALQWCNVKFEEAGVAIQTISQHSARVIKTAKQANNAQATLIKNNNNMSPKSNRVTLIPRK